MIDMNNKLGGWSIGNKLFNYICENLPNNSTILEFGSGYGTIELSKYYNIYSVEHDSKWLNLSKNVNYIYAPIKKGWYDINMLKQNIPNNYDLIIIDGPPKKIGRIGFYNNINLFKTNIPIIVDDTHRSKDLELLKNISKYVKKQYILILENDKSFGVIS